MMEMGGRKERDEVKVLRKGDDGVKRMAAE
jgi:hypothetical protein